MLEKMLDENHIVKGPPGKCIIPEDVSVGEYLVQCIKKRNPDDVFCIDGTTNETLTCGEVLDKIFKTVVLLRNQGINPGDVVAIISENSMQYCIAMYAVYYCGAAVNLLNPVYTSGELQRILSITKPKLVFCSKSVLKNLNSIKSESSFENQIILLKKDSSTQDILTLEDCLESTILNEEIRPPKVTNNQTSIILLSSGTTGLPKCLMLSETNVKYGSATFGNPDIMKTPGDAAICVLPFCHIFGSSLITNAALFAIKLIILPTFQPSLFLDNMQKHKITTLYAVPPIISFLAEHPLVKSYDVSNVTTVLCGGNSLKVELLDKCFEAIPNAEIIMSYGLTEFSGLATTCTKDKKCHFKADSVGMLVPNAEAMIWNADLKKSVGPLKTGEICLRGPLVMKGYMEEKTKDVDEYGFLHTGDIGYYDEDGYLYIVGRIKELIKYKGFQVAPLEIESILLQHEAVEECAVVGTPNERAGQLPTAFVVKKPDANVTEKELVQYMAVRISIHKQLHGGVKFIPALPKNSLGKVLRSSLVEMYKTL